MVINAAFWRGVGILAYLLLAGNLAFWVFLAWRARKKVLYSEILLFATGLGFTTSLLLSVALPEEWRTPLVNSTRALALGCGMAFTLHTVLALRNRVDMTEQDKAAQRERIEAKIAAYREHLLRERDEQKRAQILWQIRALEQTLDELDGNP